MFVSVSRTSAPVRPDTQSIAEGLVGLLVWARRKVPPQLNSSVLTTLATLHYAGPLRISELAEREGLTQPGMTTLVRRLVEQGLAERFADHTDGRATLVEITPSGAALLTERISSRAHAMVDDIAALSPAHRDALATALDAINTLSAPSNPKDAQPITKEQP